MDSQETAAIIDNWLDDMPEPAPAEPTEPTELECCLENYTSAVSALEAFEAYNSEIFAKWREHQQAANDAEATLKEVAREQGTVQNDRFTVLVTRRASRSYDADRIIELAPWVREVPGVLVTSVDKKKVETLVKGGMIPAEIAEQALRVEQMTTAVQIRRKG